MNLSANKINYKVRHCLESPQKLINYDMALKSKRAAKTVYKKYITLVFK